LKKYLGKFSDTLILIKTQIMEKNNKANFKKEIRNLLIEIDREWKITIEAQRLIDSIKDDKMYAVKPFKQEADDIIKKVRRLDHLINHDYPWLYQFPLDHCEEIQEEVKNLIDWLRSLR